MQHYTNIIKAVLDDSISMSWSLIFNIIPFLKLSKKCAQLNKILFDGPSIYSTDMLLNTHHMPGTILRSVGAAANENTLALLDNLHPAGETATNT